MDMDPPAVDTAALAERLSDLINSSWITQAIDAGIKLGVFEELNSGASDVRALATRLGCNADTLRRLLQALECLELCEGTSGGVFALTAMGRLLPVRSEGSLGPWASLWNGPLAQLWTDLPGAVRSGRSGRDLRGQLHVFAHLEGDRDKANAFNAAMASNSHWVAEAFARCAPLASTKCLVDVGGGYGVLLAAVLQRHAGLRGIVFDLPHAVEGAQAQLARLRDPRRANVVAGDFFECVPEGDAHVLKSVLHDWDGDDCRRILHRCREATTRSGRIWIVERLVDGALGPTLRDRAWARSDLNMLVAHGACERTAGEYSELLRDCGFSPGAILPLAMGVSALEAAAI